MAVAAFPGERLMGALVVLCKTPSAHFCSQGVSFFRGPPPLGVVLLILTSSAPALQAWAQHRPRCDLKMMTVLTANFDLGQAIGYGRQAPSLLLGDIAVNLLGQSFLPCLRLAH